MDFDASSLQQQVKVVTAAAPVTVQAPAVPFTANVASAQQFPALGSRQVQAPATTAWSVPLYQNTAPAIVTQTAQTAPSVATPVPAPQPVTTRIITGPTATPQPYPVTYTQAPATSYATYAAPVAPVAVRTVVKEAPEKDRRSRMAVSTMHQAPKKGGAGGSYTWGTAGDVQDYDPAPVTETKVTLAPQVVVQPGPASPFTANIASAQQFPALGSQPVAQPASVWYSQPATIKEAPVAPASAATTPAAASPAQAAAAPVQVTSSPGLAPSPAPAVATGSPQLSPTPVPTPAPVTTLEAPGEAKGSNCSIQ